MSGGEVRDAPIGGFSHVQLNVRDVPTSENWYAVTLGLERLMAAEDGSYVALQSPSAKLLVVLSVGRSGTDDRGALDHLAFAVSDGGALLSWADMLTDRGIDHDGVVDELGKPSLVLLDPDGNRIELVAPPGSWPTEATPRDDVT